jgi:sugar phosphate permease
MCSRWYHYKNIGTIMALLSISYLAGDGFSRLYFSIFVYFNANWSQLFIISGLSLFLPLILAYYFIYDSPTDIGFFEPEGLLLK